MGLASCAKELEINQEHPSTDENPMLVTLTANQEGTATRTAISPDNQSIIHWSAGDAISVFDGESANVKFTLVGGDGTSKGVFQGKVTKLAESYTALYPYQENVTMDAYGMPKGVVLKNKQKAIAGSFDPEAALMMANANTGSKTLQFLNAVGFFAVTPAFDCTKISIQSNDPQVSLAGTAGIKVFHDLVWFSDRNGHSRVSIEGDIKANNTYYIAVFPGELINGFKLIFTDSLGKETYKESAKQLNIKRNHVTNLGTIASDLPEFIPYVTFVANEEQTFSMTLASGIGTFKYSVNNGEWKTVESGKDVAFGGTLGDLRLRGESEYGTAENSSNYTTIKFGNEVAVGCMGDIRTLIDWKTYNKVDTQRASFTNLFSECRSLYCAPELPATELAGACYKGMFTGCKLTAAPELPATTLAPNCYESMFAECNSLRTVPKLPATTLATNCYKGMFYRCGNIHAAPELPATTLAPSCYEGMFYKTGLITAPELPATSLAPSCYKGMFAICDFATAPKLPATTLAPSCYEEMFYMSGLTTAPELPATTLAANCYKSMFAQSTELSTAPKLLPATSLAPNCYESMFAICEELTTVAELPATTLAANCYKKMFAQCTKLVNTPELPGTILAPSCYEGMFDYCESLTNAPELPAAELAEACYKKMFNSCIGLTVAPELPATKLAQSCYESMFYYCERLTNAPELPATELAEACYKEMFNGCIGLTVAPELPATKLARSCYESMFIYCDELTTAPVLYGETLAQDCYKSMFKYSYKLSDVRIMSRSDYPSQVEIYGDDWLEGVEYNGTIHKRPGVNLSGWIPSGWTVEEDIID